MPNRAFSAPFVGNPPTISCCLSAVVATEVFELDENGNLSGYEKVGPKVASLFVRVDPNDPEAGSYGVSGVEMWRIENRTHIVEVLFDSTE